MARHFEKRTDEEGNEFVMYVNVNDIGPRTVADCEHEIQMKRDQIRQLEADKVAIIAELAREQ